MRRVWLFAPVFAAVAAVSVPASADDKAGWSTVKGQVVFPAGKDIPERKKLDITQDKAHCLSKGDILDESVIVNPKTRGVKNVVVWLRPDDDKNAKAALPKDKIFSADAQRKPAEVVLDQPCCMFTPRVTVARVGDTILAKNSAPVAHNLFWSSGNNGEFNPTIPAGKDFKIGPLVPEASPIAYKCSIHPWMAGYVRVFDHPYFAVTDDDGKFEIKNAPAGKFRLVYWHENGFKGGAPGRFGDPVEIGGATTELKPTDFDVTPKK
jgi:plastocyanin